MRPSLYGCVPAGALATALAAEHVLEAPARFEPARPDQGTGGATLSKQGTASPREATVALGMEE